MKKHGRSPFRFEASWLKHAGFIPFVQNIWPSLPGSSTTDRLKHLATELRKWSREHIGQLFSQIEDLKGKLLAIQNCVPTTDTLVNEVAITVKLN
ncbi:hypothetical protein BVC80_1679g33 [Macleaya cordata]|uniref:Uncharacterized protein n=1 Tax=Macleaya cordata TaxID=56857 RepID=A0A200Q0R6_MACCD|nr:hypothetical protein BVC80_1679g33 [Macleaya cordata]